MRGDVHRIKPPKGRQGHQQRGQRLAVIVQSDKVYLSTVIVAPTSTAAIPTSTRPQVEIDGETTHVMAEQIMAVDWSQLGDPIGHLSHDEMVAVDQAIHVVLFR